MINFWHSKKELRLAFAALVALGLVIYNGSLQKVQGEERTVTETEEAKSVKETEDWLEYHSNEYGYRISFPKEFEVREENNTTTIVPKQKAKGASGKLVPAGIVVEVLELENVDLKEFVILERDKFGENGNINSKSGSGTITSVVPFVVSGKVGYSYETRGAGQSTYLYLPLKDLTVLKARFDHSVLGWESIWEQMLSGINLD